MAGLRHKQFIEPRKMRDEDGDVVDRVFVTDLGEKWLLENQQELNLRLPGDEDMPI
jgi:hypothetical protein